MGAREDIRKIAVVTGSRADYGILRPVLCQIADDRDLKLQLVVTGMHLSHEFGHTADAIEADGFMIDHRLETLVSSDTPAGTAKSIGLGVLAFADLWAWQPPGAILIAGDRFEILSAAVAAMPFNIPIAHVHGGEVTEGAIDESIRHSLSKLSHVHFTSTSEYSARLVRMGEHPDRVFRTGAPGLDTLLASRPLDPDRLASELGVRVAPGTLLVTFHSTTRDLEGSTRQFGAVLDALLELDRPVLFTYPNADAGGRKLIAMIKDFEARYPRAHSIRSLGAAGYRTVLSMVDAMVGNSSSGIIEASSFALPVINVGNRQSGRIRPGNVVDVEAEPEAIVKAVMRATSSDFRAGLAGMDNPYGDGSAAESIVEHLKRLAPTPSWLAKGFYDAP